VAEFRKLEWRLVMEKERSPGALGAARRGFGGNCWGMGTEENFLGRLLLRRRFFAVPRLI
jgi:hypothetical protein